MLDRAKTVLTVALLALPFCGFLALNSLLVGIVSWFAMAAVGALFEWRRSRRIDRELTEMLRR